MTNIDKHTDACTPSNCDISGAEYAMRHAAPEPPTLSDEICALLRVSLDTGKVEVSEIMAVAAVIAALRAEVREAKDQRDEYHDERDRAADDVRALRAELADARAELKRWDELRRAVAECNGMDANTWPEHGNAPLAIASTVALQQLKLDQIARSASGEDDRARSEETDNDS